MATITRGYSFGSTEQVTNTKLHTLVDSASVAGILNADIDSGATISDTKLDLATIAQSMQFNGATTVAATMTMSAAIFKPAKGADVASAAGNIALGDDGNVFDITGTAAITSITAKTAGTIVVLQFDSTATLTDGSNLKLAGNFQGAAESTITLYSDGTNWFEVSRSPISVPTATQSDMETATSNSTYVSPAVVKFHPSNAKAWAIWNGGTSGTSTANASYNVTNIVKNSTGNYTIYFATGFSSVNYAYAGFCQSKAGANNFLLQQSSASAGASSLTIETFTGPSLATIADASLISLVVYGDL